MKDKPKAIYLIGAGALNLYVIRCAKECGLKVIATDQDKDAPGRKKVDLFACIDGADTDAHLEFVRSLLDKYSIVGVYCGAEFGFLPRLYISKFLDIPHSSESAIVMSLDKRKMREAFHSANISSPVSAIAESLDDIRSINAAGKTFVLKPTKGSGSRGVIVVEAGDNLQITFKKSMNSVSGNRAVLVEEFVEGRHIDANGILLDDAFYPAGVLERYMSPLPERLPVGGYDPANISKEEYIKVYSLLEEGARALGITHGPVKGDFIRKENGEYILLEVSARFHGDVTTSYTLPFGSHLDPIRFYFHYLSTGNIVEEFISQSRQEYAQWSVILLPPGKIIGTFPTYEKLPSNISLLWHNPRLENNIVPYTSTADIPGYICAYGKDKKETSHVLQSFFSKVKYPIVPEEKYTGWYRRLLDGFKDTPLFTKM
jgi:formate-dependent phosphoribosylglycinamide formyltransferase (GAR transformylase)